MIRALALAVLLVACEGCRPNPPLPPPDGPGTCEDWCAGVAALPNACGVDPATCLDDCRKTVAAEEAIGRRYPLGCLTAAAKESCERVWQCK